MVVVEVNGYTIEAGANFSGADLSGADLRGAWLFGTGLATANLKDTDLEGATAIRSTRWPEGFDPVAAGVIFD